MNSVDHVAEIITEVPPDDTEIPPAAEDQIMELMLAKLPSTANNMSSLTK